MQKKSTGIDRHHALKTILTNVSASVGSVIGILNVMKKYMENEKNPSLSKTELDEMLKPHLDRLKGEIALRGLLNEKDTDIVDRINELEEDIKGRIAKFKRDYLG